MDKNRLYNFLITIIKGVLISIAISLVAVLIFALIVKVSDLSNTVIKAVNQFIKVLAVFFGCFITVRQDKGLLRGMVTGFVCTISLYLIFVFIGGNSINASILLEGLFGLIVGGASGVLSVNIRKK